MWITNFQFFSPLANETKSEPQNWFYKPYNAIPWNEEPTH